MLSKIFLLGSLVEFSLPVVAQERSPAKVLAVKRDRTGGSFANRWTVRCDAAEQILVDRRA
jgi:hypothetical protein